MATFGRRAMVFWTLVPFMAACHQVQSAELVPSAAAAGLAELRTATAPYLTLDVAVAAGYASDVTQCLVHEHHGAMGYHHINKAYLDRTVEVTRPEILLYERMPGGEYRLNGVEFIVPYRVWPGTRLRHGCLSSR